MKILALILTLSSFTCFGTSTNFPSSFEGTIIHSSSQTSPLKIDIESWDNCTLKEKVLSCDLSGATGSIADKDLTLISGMFYDQSQHSKNFPFAYYIKAKIPFGTNDELLRGTFAMLFDKEMNLKNVHLKIRDIGLTEQVLIEKIEL